MSGNRSCSWAEACELWGEKASRVVAGVYDAARRRQRRTCCVSAAKWLGPWIVAWVVVAGVDQMQWRVLCAGVGVVAGGALGRRIVELLPVRVDLAQVFVFGPGSMRFWTALESHYRKTRFHQLLEEHGPQSFIPRNIAQLRAAMLKDESNWGSYPARLLRNEEIWAAGLGEWVATRTKGAIEMAEVLCEAPSVRTIDDLVALMERLGKRAERIPATA